MESSDLLLKDRVKDLEQQLNQKITNGLSGMVRTKSWQRDLRRASYFAQDSFRQGKVSIPESIPLHLEVSTYAQEANLLNHKLWVLLLILSGHHVGRQMLPDEKGRGPTFRNFHLLTYNKNLDETTLLERKELLWTTVLELLNSKWIGKESGTSVSKLRRGIKGQRSISS